MVISSGGDGKRKAREGVVSQVGKEEMAKWKQKCELCFKKRDAPSAVLRFSNTLSTTHHANLVRPTDDGSSDKRSREHIKM